MPFPSRNGLVYSVAQLLLSCCRISARRGVISARGLHSFKLYSSIVIQHVSWKFGPATCFRSEGNHLCFGVTRQDEADVVRKEALLTLGVVAVQGGDKPKDLSRTCFSAWLAKGLRSKDFKLRGKAWVRPGPALGESPSGVRRGGVEHGPEVRRWNSASSQCSSSGAPLSIQTIWAPSITERGVRRRSAAPTNNDISGKGRGQPGHDLPGRLDTS